MIYLMLLPSVVFFSCCLVSSLSILNLLPCLCVCHKPVIFPPFLWKQGAFKGPSQPKKVGWLNYGLRHESNTCLLSWVRLYRMFCAKEPRTLRNKDCLSNCWGQNFQLSTTNCRKSGLKDNVCLCLKHDEEVKLRNHEKEKSECCFPKSSDDKCSGGSIICPQRLVTVMNNIIAAKTIQGKIC